MTRASRLLMLVASGKTDGTCKALAKAAGLAVPTAHHLLGTLVTDGLLARDSSTRYLLGPKIAVLAEAFHRELAVPESLLRPLEQLADTTGETTYLAAWRNGNIQILGMAEGSLPVRVSLPSGGSYVDAHARASGKVLLAYAPERLRDRYLARNPLRPLTPHTVIDAARFAAELDRVRQQGFGTDEEEFLPGVCCVAAPVLDEEVLVAVYSMSLPAHRFAQRRDDLTRALTSTAEAAAAGAGLVTSAQSKQPPVPGAT